MSRRDRMRILVLDSGIPFPPATGAQSRTFHLLKTLAHEHDLTLVGFHWDSLSNSDQCPFPMEVVRVPWELPENYMNMHDPDPAVSESACRYLGRGTREPWFVSYYESPAMVRALRAQTGSFDLILIEHSFMARFLPALPPLVPTILDMHNVHALMAWRRVQENSGPDRQDALWEFHRTRSFERMVCHACRLCLCCSEKDAGAARRILKIKKVKVIPNGVDTFAMRPSGPPPDCGCILFTGMMNYQPNVEAVRFFAAEILPVVRATVPQATFHIAGSNPAREVKVLGSDSVFIHGSVPDMRPFFAQASVVVVPLLHGGGTRLKILEAAACGRPVVSSSLGAEGLKFADGRDILIRDSAHEFAQAVVELLTNPRLRSELSESARRTAEIYDWSTIGTGFRTAVLDAARGSATAGPLKAHESAVAVRSECQGGTLLQ